MSSIRVSRWAKILIEGDCGTIDGRKLVIIVVADGKSIGNTGLVQIPIEWLALANCVGSVATFTMSPTPITNWMFCAAALFATHWVCESNICG